MNKKLRGLIAATHTPFQPNGDIAPETVPEYVEYLLRNRVDGLYVNGSTGEGISMSVSERKTMLEAFLDAVKGRIPVVAQVGANALRDSAELAAHAESVGVTAVSACAPSYFKVASASVLTDSMAEIAAAAPKTPFYYYHIPKFTGLSIDMGRFLDEAARKIPNLVGVKYSDTKVFEFQEILEYDKRRFDVLWGCDEMLLSALVVGAEGAVGSTYPLCSRISRNVLEAWQSGDFETARLWQLRSWEYVKVLSRYGDLLAGQRILTRELPNALGVDLGPCRLPLEMMNEENGRKMLADLETIGYHAWQSPAF